MSAPSCIIKQCSLTNLSNAMANGNRMIRSLLLVFIPSIAFVQLQQEIRLFASGRNAGERREINIFIADWK
ncbi:MAG TPA: hypothetical protein VMG34_13645 [Bacteroidota bacterium]|nr:hypothetical protein [Bacteroidota bacterium]